MLTAWVASLMLAAAPEAVAANDAYELRARVEGGAVVVRLLDKASGWVVSEAPYFYRAVTAAELGEAVQDRLAEPQVTGGGNGLTIAGRLAGLDVEHVFALPADKPWMEERITLRNGTGAAVALKELETGFQRPITNERIDFLPEVAGDRFVAIPFRHRATDPPEFNNDFGVNDLLTQAARVQSARDPFGKRLVPSRHRVSEGWAWTHGAHTLGIFKFNQEAMEFSALSLLSDSERVGVRFGGTVLSPTVQPGQAVAFGVTRYRTTPGDYTNAYYAFRDFLAENGCALPKDFDPPVHWNELYDNPEWTLSTPGRPEGPRMTRPQAYTKALIELEAAKARDYSCQSLYLDPGWDTDFGTLLWGEQWLGPRKAFVQDMRAKYGLGVSLHCPLATWMSMDGRGVPSWPREALRMGPDGQIVEGSVCLGSKQYLDACADRLLANCADGVVYLMFDGNWWNGGCWNPDHGHPVPYTMEDHCRANLDLAQRVHAKFPRVLIEMHDMITGGSDIRQTPVYYKYGLPGSYDDNWGLELMWDSTRDVRGGRGKSLYYYNLACDIPMYLHIDLRDDNEQCQTLWWFASTCRHLGIGGTHNNPAVAQAQKTAMQRYRELERYYKRGRFYGMQDVAEGVQKEEIHLHVLPEEQAFVVNLFNLSDRPRSIAGSVPVARLGLDPNKWYTVPKGCGFDAGSGRFFVDRPLEPWGTYVVEVRALK